MMEYWLYDHSDSSRRTLSIQKEPVTIGRDESCEIVLKSPFVAKQHARIIRKGNQLFVENLGRSVTRVANREILPNKLVRIEFGDEIQIGPFSVAAVRPGDKNRSAIDTGARLRERQKKLMDFEQAIHARLLERMNLRVTGHINKNDENYVTQILQHMEQILDEHMTLLDEDVIAHSIHLHLHRMVVAEVVRQCQGRVQTDYQSGDDRLLDDQRERAINEVVVSIVDMMPLLFDPSSEVGS